MLKKARLTKILELVNTKGILTAAELVSILKVSDMTIRRDLDELDQSGRLIRIHGGAESLSYNIKEELEHSEKQMIHQAEKREIAEIAASYIAEGDSVFLGSGTTIELMAEFIHLKSLRIITNSLPVFESFKNKAECYELILLGGNYRQKTGAFIGGLVHEALDKMCFAKCFLGLNGIYDDGLYMSTADEGRVQKDVLDQTIERYIVADRFKVNRTDFYNFYKLHEINGLITNPSLEPEFLEEYSKFTNIITKSNKR